MFEFKILKKVDVLNFDPTLDLSLNDISTVNYNKKINFFCFLQALIFSILKLNFKNFKKQLSKKYFYLYCKKLNPKVAIGNEVDGKIFKYKNFFPEKVTICFQMSLYRSEHKFLTKKRLEKYSSDYFLSYDKWHTKYFDFLKSKFFEVGSVKANSKNYPEKDKIYDIMFVSQYRENSHVDPIKYYYASSGLSTVNNYLVFKKLADFCRENNKKLCVALVSNRREKKYKIKPENEIKFFKSIDENFLYEKINNFELAKKSKLIVSVDSTFGIELLYLGHKVLLMNPLGFIGVTHIFDGKESEGEFWTNKHTTSELDKKILKLINMRDIEFKEIIKKENFEINHDPENSKIKEIIKKHLK